MCVALTEKQWSSYLKSVNAGDIDSAVSIMQTAEQESKTRYETAKTLIANMPHIEHSPARKAVMV